jgi:FtsP/CotA-like multicopper oxidase with cupredoxin domain
MGPGQRIDVLVKAGAPGTYTLETLDPNAGNVDGKPCCSVSPYRDAQFPDGIDPQRRDSHRGFDFPLPCAAQGFSALLGVPVPTGLVLTAGDPCAATPRTILSYPIALAIVEVSGAPVDMQLPTGPLPAPTGLPSVDTMRSRTPDAVRHVAFEICGNRPGSGQDPLLRPNGQLPSCGWYFGKYSPEYWGGLPFNNLLMLRDADDVGKPNPNNDPNMPRIDFKKQGLFDPNEPLFSDMVAGNYEEWTVLNRSFSDHPFHIHQNHFLVTKINDVTLPRPEWHDTIIVPAAVPKSGSANINDATFGSITFRTYFNPITVGCFVMHCHVLNHEDIGMMQRLDILPAKGQPSGCVPEAHQAGLPNVGRLLANAANFAYCGVP